MLDTIFALTMMASSIAVIASAAAIVYMRAAREERKRHRKAMDALNRMQR